MKSIKLLLAAAFVCSGLNSLEAQNFYQPSHDSKPYALLPKSAISLTTSNGNNFYHMPSRQWMVFNTPTGDTLRVLRNGIFESRGSQYRVSLSPCLTNLVIRPNLNSGVFVKEDTTTTPARLSIEWRNFGIKDADTGDFVNFTIHIYENQVIEFHYGSSLVTDATAFNGYSGPGVYAIQTTLDFLTSIEMHTLGGDPANPQYFSNITSFYAVDSFPKEGTVYRFSPYNIELEEWAKDGAPALFPNPAYDILHIDDAGPVRAEVFSNTGQRVGSLTFLNGKADVSALSRGAYFLKVKDGDTGQVWISKLILQ